MRSYEMSDSNPYASPTEGKAATKSGSGWNKVGTAVLVVGLATLAYGAVAFWIVQSLPPNGGASGRLPSLYVMGAGIALSLLGLTALGFRWSGKENPTGDTPRKAIPTSVGILVLLAIIIAVIVAISQL